MGSMKCATCGHKWIKHASASWLPKPCMVKNCDCRAYVSPERADSESLVEERPHGVCRGMNPLTETSDEALACDLAELATTLSTSDRYLVQEAAVRLGKRSEAEPNAKAKIVVEDCTDNESFPGWQVRLVVEHRENEFLCRIDNFVLDSFVSPRQTFEDQYQKKYGRAVGYAWSLSQMLGVEVEVPS